MRKGEFLRLSTDAIVRIGDRDWLHVPVGKLTATATFRCTRA
ncbi:MAG TPA: hypothetical protein VMH35_19265 [Streptosporangiaceae bacterium]|nr:hypothetical protein [Streptosporangiaceae bacterium]